MASPPTLGRRSFLVALVGAPALLVAAGCAGAENEVSSTTAPASGNADEPAAGQLGRVTFQVWRDPGWGCCTGWVGYLADNGIDATIVDDPERAERRRGLGVPDAAASCHTALVDGYVLEGHIPVGAIERLLEDRSDIVGLALPGMPADSPGMGGDETSWEAQNVMAIATNGNLSPFDYWMATVQAAPRCFAACQS